MRHLVSQPLQVNLLNVCSPDRCSSSPTVLNSSCDHNRYANAIKPTTKLYQLSPSYSVTTVCRPLPTGGSRLTTIFHQRLSLDARSLVFLLNHLLAISLKSRCVQHREGWVMPRYMYLIMFADVCQEVYRLLVNNLMRLTELRRNPSHNLSRTDKIAAREYLQKLMSNGVDLDRVGVSMTSEPKLGINPASRTDSATPLGVYFYPAAYWLDVTRTGRLPYANDAKYINVFEFGGRVLDLSAVTTDQADGIIAQAVDYAKSFLVSDTAISRLVKIAERDADGNHAMRAWYTMHNLITDTNSRALKTNQGVRWNHMLRELGFDSVLDMDDGGIIYPDEPTQGVILTPTIIKNVKRFENIASTYRTWAGKLLACTSALTLARTYDRIADQIAEEMRYGAKVPLRLIGHIEKLLSATDLNGWSQIDVSRLDSIRAMLPTGTAYNMVGDLVADYDSK